MEKRISTMKEFNLNKDGLYLVAVSGGPDSMALLNMLYEQGFNVVVTHVNYHTRKESSYEEEMVKEYCHKRDIPFYIKSASTCPKRRNFEAWAREERYSFFKEIYLNIKASSLLVAHHKDDFVETYLMQKKRKAIYSYYGIKEETTIYSMLVKRVLLDYRKKDLEKYCLDNNVPYSIDVTNLLDVHTRNKIRHEIVEKLTDDECNKIILEAHNINEERKKIVESIAPFLEKDVIEIKEFLSFSKEMQDAFLYNFLIKKEEKLINKLSYLRLCEIKNIINSSKPNLKMELVGDLFLVKEYDKVFIKRLQEEKTYSYLIESPSVVDKDEFYIDLTIDTSFIKIYPSSYPLTLRNALKDDVVGFGGIHKKVNRILIDAKVPVSKRKSYPILVDNEGKVVYIPLFTSEEQKSIATKLKVVIK